MARTSPRLLAAIFAAAILGGSSCAEPDPPYGDPNGIAGKKLPNESASSAAVDGGASSASAPFPAAYSPTDFKPTITVLASHAAAVSKGAPTGIPVVCSDCHNPTGAGKAKVFAFGGRVMKGTEGAQNVDVIITGAATLGPVKTDADGFFWLLGTPIAATGSLAAVRNASGISKMTSAPQTSCDISGCHADGGSQGRVGKGLP